MVKIMTITGTRPEMIKMSRVISAFDSVSKHIFVHTGQNFSYELHEIFFQDLALRPPDYTLKTDAATVAGRIARIIEATDGIMAEEMPDALLIYGDTNSALAAIAAKRRQIPIFHFEAGNRCFDERVPEESNRRMVDHISDINLVLTEHARRYLLAEGLRPERIFKTGSHLPEVLDFVMPRVRQSAILSALQLEMYKYLLVSVHREENLTDERLKLIVESLEILAATFNVPVIVSTHPRTKQRLTAMGLLSEMHLLRFLPAFGYCDYVHLQLHALCVISDSGSLMEEASLLNLPAVTIRDTHERPEGMDEGVLIMSSIHPERLRAAVHTIITSHNYDARNFNCVADYNQGAVSPKIVRIVFSYIDYIDREIWRRKKY